ncbi:MAG: aspartate aminotransferase family protein [Planctomycetota bacterium]|jgi:glutamate-1-semialdehyde 2,1-aminomutase
MKLASKNEKLFAKAKSVLPGGVSSPVRAFAAVDGAPIFFDRAAGSSFTDIEGDSYLDFVQSWGPLPLGHSHPEVIEAVTSAARLGMSFGAPHVRELELGQRIVELYPGAAQVRFVSSGTEATMTAIRLGRAATGRKKILKFAGCYHGHSDCLLVEAGSGAVTFGQPSSAGVPEELSALTAVLPLDDLEGLRKFFSSQGDELAAVIIEPIPANNGLLLQSKEYLQELRRLTEHHGVVLIFDEVISGFRVSPGGAAEIFDIVPDLATFGKVIGGGMAVGAVAGSRKIMSLLSPEGPVYQAGTLSGNPLAMAAGAKTLEVMLRDQVWDKLESLGKRLEDGLTNLKRNSHLPIAFARMGSIFWICLGCDSAPSSAEGIPKEAAGYYRKLHSACLKNSIYLAPSSYEVGFISAAHTEEDIDDLVSVLAAVIPTAIPSA